MLSIKDPVIAALVAVGEFGPRTFASTNTTLPTPELVDFDDDGVVGGLYRPSKSGPKSRIAVYVMHAERAYLSFSAYTSTQTRLHDLLCKPNDASKSRYMIPCIPASTTSSSPRIPDISRTPPTPGHCSTRTESLDKLSPP